MMQNRKWSLRRRLMLLLLVPLLVVGVILLLDAYRSARIAADRAHDRLIAGSALAIADRVAVSDGTLDIDLPYVAFEMLATSAHDRVFYRITDTRGAFVTGYPDLQEPGGRMPEQDNSPLFYDTKFRGEEVRVVLLKQAVTGPGSRGQFSVQVAQTRGERDLLTRELAVGTGVRLLLMIVLVALITWFGTRLGLKPLARLRAEIRQRSPQDLRPLNVEVPREVRDLVSAIDTLMRRLERSLASMEQFIADAAHQLRAPLAALQTQVETALRGAGAR